MKIDYFKFIAINLIAVFDRVNCFADLNLLQNDTRFGFISGDYVIEALFPIHEKIFNEKKLYFECDGITEYGIQIVEAALFAVDLINRDETILPNFTLGIDIRDYCGVPDVAKSQIEKITERSVECNGTEVHDIFSFVQNGIASPLIGIIGPETSTFFRKFGNELEFLPIVQIFYSEPLLETAYSGIEDPFGIPVVPHPYYFSVTSEKKFMTEAILDILTTNNWTYIALVYENEIFQNIDVELFKRFASGVGVCIADIIHPRSILNLEDEFLQQIMDIRPWLDKIDAIVCHCSPYMMNLLFKVLKEYSVRRFPVIGGDGWLPTPSHPHEPEQDVAVSEIQVTLEPIYIEEFDDYYLNLDLETNERNPWFEEFWQEHFKCEIIPYNGSEYPQCSGNEKLANGYKQSPKVPYVIKSVFVLAHALHFMLVGGCKFLNPCETPGKKEFNRWCYLKYVQYVGFNFYGELFEFDYRSSNPQIRKFNFYNFQHLENGSYDYVQVGKYIRENSFRGSRKIKLNDELIHPGNTFFKSSCNVPCPPNHAKVLKKDKCCWDCVLCKPLEILINMTRCEKCENGFMSNSNKTSCVAIPMEYIKWNDGQSLISLLLSSLCIILTSFTFYVFFKNEHTPVVKSSTKELCYVMFTGMISANLATFTILQIPNVINCAVVRTIPPISFAFIYAALLVKTNRIARILAISKKKFPKLNPRFLSLRAQLVFTISLIITEVLICAHSLFEYSVEPENVFRQKNNSYYGIKLCPLREETMFELFAFIGGLILICTYYAVKTRNLPENFNEAKYIGFAMYATILTDISFGLIYFGSDVKTLSINLCISINTLIVLIFLFAPKLYAILRMPEKNTRGCFVTTKNIRCAIGNRRECGEQKPVPD